MLPTIFDWTDERMNESDEVWKWVYQKYAMSQIVIFFNRN